MRLKLTVTDTPGFGDQINNDKWLVNLLCRCHVSFNNLLLVNFL